VQYIFNKKVQSKQIPVDYRTEKTKKMQKNPSQPAITALDAWHFHFRKGCVLGKVEPAIVVPPVLVTIEQHTRGKGHH
jgi:hypothetical protein